MSTKKNASSLPSQLGLVPALLFICLPLPLLLNKHISIRKIKWRENHHWNIAMLEDNKTCTTGWSFTTCWMLTGAKYPCTFLKCAFPPLSSTKQMLIIFILKVRNVRPRSWEQYSQMRVNIKKSLTQWHSCWVHNQQAFVDRRPLSWVGSSKFPLASVSATKTLAVPGSITKSNPAIPPWLRKCGQALMGRAHLTNFEDRSREVHLRRKI